MEQTIIGNAIPRLFVVTVDGNLKIDLRPILKIPSGRGEQRIDQFRARGGLTNPHSKFGNHSGNFFRCGEEKRVSLWAGETTGPRTTRPKDGKDYKTTDHGWQDHGTTDN